MRLAFILAGTALIHRLAWVLPIFGLFLVYTACRLTRRRGAQIDPQQTMALRLGRRWLRVAKGDFAQFGRRFLTRQDGRWHITPLLLVVLVLESTDLLFAVDSVPAILGISTDPYIVFTSNIFAILGLRALYFLVAGMLDRFCYLNYGLAAVLGFVGAKMIAQWWFAGNSQQPWIPAWVSLAVIIALLGIAILASIIHTRSN